MTLTGYNLMVVTKVDSNVRKIVKFVNMGNAFHANRALLRIFKISA